VSTIAFRRVGPGRPDYWGRLKRAVRLGLVGLALSCQPEAEQVEEHLARAETLLAENRGAEALIELHNAALLRPNDPDLGLRVAEVSVRYGYFGDAVDFYRDALALRPDDEDTLLKLAWLLVEIDPKAAEKRIDELLARDPNNARAFLVRAQAALLAGEIDAAMRHISSARRAHPSEPEIERMLALAYEARGRAALSRNPMAVRSPRVTLSILRAWDRYLARKGEFPLLGHLGRARTLGWLPGRAGEANEAYRVALEKSRSLGSPYERVRTAQEAARFADRNNNTELAEQAIGRWLEIAPRDLEAWQALIDLDNPDPVKHRQQTFRSLLKAIPDDPRVQVLYAQNLMSDQGLSAALGHLESKMDQGESDAILLFGTFDIQNQAGRLNDAAGTLRTMHARFPDHPATRLALGEQQVREGRYDDAVTSLERALAVEASGRGFRALARAEQQRGQLEKALEAINKTIGLERGTDPSSLRLKALIQRELGQEAGVAATLLRLRRLVGLSPSEKLHLAQSYYNRNAHGIGRKVLTGLLESGDAGPGAALEFARRDAGNADHRPRIRHYLEQSFEKFPDKIELLAALTEVDALDGRVEEARRRLNTTIAARSWVGKPYLVRGEFLLGIGELVGARDDAERALRLDPSTANEAFDIMTVAYVQSGGLPGVIAGFEAQRAETGLSADRTGLLARLQLAAGNTERALELYGMALDEGSDLLFVKNDLAFLLASTGGDLDRALSLAKMAENAPGDDISTADTLGFVYLKQGKPDVAVWQFRQVVAEANPPVADYYHHLGLALFELGKDDQALQAFRRALALNPQFGDAEIARQRIAQIGARNREAPPEAKAQEAAAPEAS